MLKHRIQSGILLGAALLLSLFFLPPWLVLVVLLVINALALFEFYALLDASKLPHFKIVGVFCGSCLVACTWFALRSTLAQKADIEAYILYAMTGIIFFRQLFQKDDQRPWETMAGTLLGIMYVSFLFNFFTKLLLGWGDQAGRFLLLYLVVVVKFTDIGAFFVGCGIGKHKLIPRVSPAKTWEGCIGGVVTGVAASVVYFHIWHGQMDGLLLTLRDAVVIGLLLSTAGIIGDLIESLLKRAAGVKDSGRIILGMGGILDVVDSLLFAAPVLYVYARFFVGHPG